MKIIYMGTPEIAAVILDSLLNDEKNEVVLAVTRPGPATPSWPC